MNYTMLEAAMEQAGLAVEVDALSVYRAFEQIQDGRHKQGVRYSSALILTLIVLAKLAGMTSLAGIAEWVRLRAGWLKQVLPTVRESFPCAATYSNVVRTLDAQQVTRVLNDLLIRVGAMKRDGEQVCAGARAVEEEGQAHVALDGKTLRGTLGHAAADQQKMHQLTLYDTQTGVLLKEQVTGEKQNELSIVSAFLTPVLVKGRINSADALHTQHAFCFSVTRLRWRLCAHCQGQSTHTGRRPAPLFHGAAC
jgi:DDE_Tnp_1-associated